MLVAVILTASAIVAAAVYAPRAPARPATAEAPLPSEPLPPVEPVALKPVTPETAREINDAVPFAEVANPPARPFTLSPTGDAFTRARDCLAAAGYYEAGDDTEGQRSVMQVVLNRVRHPAFPKSVCGVVFQGSERVTGCQFTFTCDGALARRPSDAAWQRARNTAAQALSGRVYKQVGVATHYHTDWVVPYWSSSLLKLTKVYTHLFFRWPGGWGSLAALQGRHAGAEPGIAKLASLSPDHGAALVDAEGNPIEGLEASNVTPTMAAVRKVLFKSDEEYLVLLKPQSADFPGAARALCGDKSYCKLRGWTDPAAAPAQLPVKDAQRDAMAFSYLRDPDAKFEKLLWNCTAFPRSNKDECMKGTYQKGGKEERTELRVTVREGKEKVSLRRIVDRIEEAKPAVEPTRVSEDRGERRRPGQ